LGRGEDAIEGDSVYDEAAHEAAELAASALPTTPCPSWCTVGDGHPWHADGAVGQVHRIHSHETYRAGADPHGFVVCLDQFESRRPDGRILREPVIVHASGDDLSTRDPERLRQIGRAYLLAGELMETIQNGEQR
jgi:hypothetical protein